VKRVDKSPRSTRKSGAWSTPRLEPLEMKETAFGGN
jgi:hypothetical protein